MLAAHQVCSRPTSRPAGRQALGGSFAMHGGRPRPRCAAHLCDCATPRQRMAHAADEQIGEGMVEAEVGMGHEVESDGHLQAGRQAGRRAGSRRASRHSQAAAVWAQHSPPPQPGNRLSRAMPTVSPCIPPRISHPPHPTPPPPLGACSPGSGGALGRCSWLPARCKSSGSRSSCQ